MKKKILLSLTLICLGILALGITVFAETYENLEYAIVDGEITITGGHVTLIATPGQPDRGELIIPSTINGYRVTSIGDRAFKNCTSITDISIPTSVTSIGDATFYRCNNLKSITIPDSVTSIGTFTFAYCDSLTNVKIGNGVTSIVDDAFKYCTSLSSVTIPDSVTSIGDSAFSVCTSLSSVTIPDSVTSIGNHAFSSCTNLTNVTIGTGVIYIGQAAFDNCEILEKVYWNARNVSDFSSYNHTFKAGYSGDGIEVIFGDMVATIPAYAFHDCTSLTSVTIPDSVTSIGKSAFKYCDELSIVYYYGTPDEWNAIDIYDGNDYLYENIIFIGPIWASKSEDGIIVEPVNIESGKTVVLALYNGNILSEITPVTYTGEIINITPTKTYTNAKVMVWEDLISMKPVCEAIEL
ncbi:MAG: leucine-rich repeat domain-containing protein [Ruminococcaceae bacterium]|nr:leucine-rich repeat domain-containing protein [Oscillospiraceae bacterium]